MARLKSITSTGDPAERDVRLAIVILVAEILRDVEVLVTEPLFQERKQRLNSSLPRITCCKDGKRLAGIVADFCADASRILPTPPTFNPANPPW